MTNGILPIDISILTETDACYRLDEDLRFLREIEYLMDHHPIEKVRSKYSKVYNIYKNEIPLFFEHFEEKGFLPSTINEDYTGNIYPFDLLSKRELSIDQEESVSVNQEKQQDLEKYDNELIEALRATLSRFTE
jgi:hypothetical protein